MPAGAKPPSPPKGIPRVRMPGRAKKVESKPIHHQTARLLSICRTKRRGPSCSPGFGASSARPVLAVFVSPSSWPGYRSMRTFTFLRPPASFLLETARLDSYRAACWRTASRAQRAPSYGCRHKTLTSCRRITECDLQFPITRKKLADDVSSLIRQNRGRPGITPAVPPAKSAVNSSSSSSSEMARPVFLLRQAIEFLHLSPSDFEAAHSELVT